MAYPQFGSLGSLGGVRPQPVPVRGGPMYPSGPVNPAMPVHPAWGINPPHFGSGAEGLANHLASLRQMRNPQFQYMMSPRSY